MGPVCPGPPTRSGPEFRAGMSGPGPQPRRQGGGGLYRAVPAPAACPAAAPRVGDASTEGMDTEAQRAGGPARETVDSHGRQLTVRHRQGV
jgi:hypothetical protein